MYHAGFMIMPRHRMSCRDIWVIMCMAIVGGHVLHCVADGRCAMLLMLDFVRGHGNAIRARHDNERRHEKHNHLSHHRHAPRIPFRTIWNKCFVPGSILASGDTRIPPCGQGATRPEAGRAPDMVCASRIRATAHTRCEPTSRIALKIGAPACGVEIRLRQSRRARSVP